MGGAQGPLEALKKKQLSELELIPADGNRYRLRRKDLWRFWRSDKPLQDSF